MKLPIPVAFRQYLRVRPSISRGIAVVALLVLIVYSAIAIDARMRDTRAIRSDAMDNLSQASARWQAALTTRVAAAIALAQGVGGFIAGGIANESDSIARVPPHETGTVAERVRYFPNESWDRYAGTLFRTVPGMLSLQLEPSGIPSQAYPSGAGVEMGRDALNATEWSKTYRRLAAVGVPEAQGPILSSDINGLFVASRFPVFVAEPKSLATWWGCGSAIFTLRGIIEGLNLTQRLLSEGYEAWVYVTIPRQTVVSPHTSSEVQLSDAQRADSVEEWVHTPIAGLSSVRELFLALRLQGGLPRADPSYLDMMVVCLMPLCASIVVGIAAYACVVAAFAFRHRCAPHPYESASQPTCIALVSIKRLAWWKEHQDAAALHSDLQQVEHDVTALATRHGCYCGGRVSDGCCLIAATNASQLRSFASAMRRLPLRVGRVHATDSTAGPCDGSARYSAPRKGLMAFRLVGSLRGTPRTSSSTPRKIVSSDSDLGLSSSGRASRRSSNPPPAHAQRSYAGMPGFATTPRSPPTAGDSSLSEGPLSATGRTVITPLSDSVVLPPTFDVGTALHVGVFSAKYDPLVDRFSYVGPGIEAAATAVDATRGGEVALTTAFAEFGQLEITDIVQLSALEDGSSLITVESNTRNARCVAGSRQNIDGLGQSWGDAGSSGEESVGDCDVSSATFGAAPLPRRLTSTTSPSNGSLPSMLHQMHRGRRSMAPGANDRSVSTVVASQTGAVLRKRVAVLLLDVLSFTSSDNDHLPSTSRHPGRAHGDRYEQFGASLGTIVRIARRHGAELAGVQDTSVTLAFNARHAVDNGVHKAVVVDRQIRKELPRARIVSVIGAGYAHVGTIDDQLLCAGDSVAHARRLLYAAATLAGEAGDVVGLSRLRLTDSILSQSATALSASASSTFQLLGHSPPAAMSRSMDPNRKELSASSLDGFTRTACIPSILRTCIVESGTAEVVLRQYEMQCLGPVAPSGALVYSVEREWSSAEGGAEGAEGDGEWLYRLHQREQSSIFSDFNRAFETLHKGKLAEGQQRTMQALSKMEALRRTNDFDSGAVSNLVAFSGIPHPSSQASFSGDGGFDEPQG